MLEIASRLFKLAVYTLILTVRRYGRLRASEAAAGMAYYAFFALFPLLLFLVAIGSFVIRAEQAQDQIARLVAAVLPVSNQVVLDILSQVLATRGTVSVIATVSLAWSASGYFNTLTRQINRAWPKTRRRHPVRARLVGLGLVGGLAALLLLWLAFTTALWPTVRDTIGEGTVGRALLKKGLTIHIVSWVAPLVVSAAIYFFAPNTMVPWWGAGIAAVSTTLLWKLVTAALLWYLRSGRAGYDSVYGSLSSTIVLLFWLYLSGAVLLFGAHLSAVICRKETILRQL